MSSGSRTRSCCDGYWQYTWKTSKNRTGCKTLTLTLSDGDTLTANFEFK